MSLTGVSQKGPFVIGSSVTIQELNESFSPNGTSFQVSTSDNLGSFELQTEISTQFVEIICTGFYYNEVTGQNTNSNLTVRNIVPVSENLRSNLNILTTLSRKRIINLVNDGELTYEDAKTQAEEEVLLVFNVSSATVEGFDQMDISGNNESDAVLLAISIMLQGEGSVSDLSTLTSTIIEDIENDGILDNTNARDQIIQNAADISLPEVRANLTSKYAELGLTIDVPDFETFISNVYENQPPTVTITSPVDGTTITQGEQVSISVTASDEDGEVRDLQLFLNDSLVSNSSEFSWQLRSGESPQSIRAMAVDDENGTTIDSIGFFVAENTIPSIEITSPQEDSEFVAGEIIEIMAIFDDLEDEVVRVNFFNNDDLIEGFDDPNEETYLIAEAVDEFGGVNRDSVLVNIKPNQLPSIDLLFPQEGGVITFGATDISLNVTDSDGWIKRVDWYLQDEYAGGVVADVDFALELSQVSIEDRIFVTSTDKVQTLRVEAIDNLDDTTTLSLSVTLAPGAVWEEFSDGTSQTELFYNNRAETASNSQFFFLMLDNRLYRSADGNNWTEILESGNNLNIHSYLIEETFDGKIWVVEWDDMESTTTVRFSTDNGDNWDSFLTSYLIVYEAFVLNNALYVVEDGTNHIYQLANEDWSLAVSTGSPWYLDPFLDGVEVMEFSNQVFAIEHNLLVSERRIWSTSDLINWNETTIEVSEATAATQYMAKNSTGLWIFSGIDDKFRTTDGINWENFSTTSEVVTPVSVFSQDDEIFLYDSRIFRLTIFSSE